MSKHIEIGKKGEALALAYLKKRGYKILRTNYRVRHMEIDIIATSEDNLVIVEVKTRQSQYLANAEDTVSKSKQKLLIRAADFFITENEIDLNTRFDIISVLLKNDDEVITHIEDAFYPV